MFTNRVVLTFNRGLKHRNPNVQHIAVLNVWSPSRNINLLQKCKDCLNTVLRNPLKGDVSEVIENCCPAAEDICSHEPTAVSTAKPQYAANVVVIGAGMAGLSAANHLQENGVANLTVLEALDRPGGRINSCWFGDVSVELGTPFGSEIQKNPITEKIFEDGLAPYSFNNTDHSRGLLLRGDGSPIPYSLSVEVYEKFKQIMAEVEEMERKESGRGKDSPLTLVGGRIEQEIRLFPTSQRIDAARAFHGIASTVFNRSNHDRGMIVSTNFGDYIKLPGSRVKVPLGFFGEINNLYEALGKEQVLLNKTVSKIRWGGVPDVFPRAVVICEDGQSFPADYIIITIPLGVLKEQADSLFCPGLPAKKLEAILKIPFCHKNKIFVEFSQPFWKWNKRFSKTDLDSTKMACKDGWLKGVVRIEPVVGSSHVMCLTVAGPQAECMEMLEDDDIIAGAISLLKEVSGVCKVSEVTKVKRTSWSGDKNFRGAYAFKEANICAKDFYNLANPLPEHTDLCDPVLLFAGEATCPVQFGTVRGAKNSGIREAERLLQLIRLQNERNEQDFTLESEKQVQCL